MGKKEGDDEGRKERAKTRNEGVGESE